MRSQTLNSTPDIIGSGPLLPAPWAGGGQDLAQNSFASTARSPKVCGMPSAQRSGQGLLTIINLQTTSQNWKTATFQSQCQVQAWEYPTKPFTIDAATPCFNFASHQTFWTLLVSSKLRLPNLGHKPKALRPWSKAPE